MTNTLTAGKSKRVKRRSVEAAGWVASIALSAVLGLSIHELASEPFTTTVDSPLALPKEFAVTSGDVEVPLPPVGQTEIAATVPAAPTVGQPAPGDQPAPTAPAVQAPVAGQLAAPQPQAGNAAPSTTPTTRAPGAPTTPTTRAPSAPAASTTPTTRPPSNNTSPPATSTPTTQAPRTTTTINRLPPPVLSAPVETAENLVNGLVGQ